MSSEALSCRLGLVVMRNETVGPRRPEGSTVQEARKQLEVEVRDCMNQPPLENKNEGWIRSTMDAADAYALAVLDEACLLTPAKCSMKMGLGIHLRHQKLRAELQGLGGHD